MLLKRCLPPHLTKKKKPFVHIYCHLYKVLRHNWNTNLVEKSRIFKLLNSYFARGQNNVRLVYSLRETVWRRQVGRTMYTKPQMQ